MAENPFDQFDGQSPDAAFEPAPRKRRPAGAAVPGGRESQPSASAPPEPESGGGDTQTAEPPKQTNNPFDPLESADPFEVQENPFDAIEPEKPAQPKEQSWGQWLKSWIPGGGESRGSARQRLKAKAPTPVNPPPGPDQSFSVAAQAPQSTPTAEPKEPRGKKAETPDPPAPGKAPEAEKQPGDEAQAPAGEKTRRPQKLKLGGRRARFRQKPPQPPAASEDVAQSLESLASDVTLDPRAGLDRPMPEPQALPPDPSVTAPPGEQDQPSDPVDDQGAAAEGPAQPPPPHYPDTAGGTTGTDLFHEALGEVTGAESGSTYAEKDLQQLREEDFGKYARTVQKAVQKAQKRAKQEEAEDPNLDMQVPNPLARDLSVLKAATERDIPVKYEDPGEAPYTRSEIQEAERRAAESRPSGRLGIDTADLRLRSMQSAMDQWREAKNRAGERRPMGEIEADVQDAIREETRQRKWDQLSATEKALAYPTQMAQRFGTTALSMPKEAYEGLSELRGAALEEFEARTGIETGTRTQYDADADPVSQLLSKPGGLDVDKLNRQLSSSPVSGGIPDQLAQALGSTVGFAGSGWIGRAISQGRSLPRLLAGGMGAGVNANATYKEAKRFGASEDEARRAALLSGIVGVGEAAPIDRLLPRFDRAYRMTSQANRLTRGRVFNHILTEGSVQGLEETIQEGSQNIANNYAIARWADENREVFEDLLGDSALGGAVGTILGGVTSAAGVGKSQFDTERGRKQAFDQLRELREQIENDPDKLNQALRDLGVPEEAIESMGPQQKAKAIYRRQVGRGGREAGRTRSEQEVTRAAYREATGRAGQRQEGATDAGQVRSDQGRPDQPGRAGEPGEEPGSADLQQPAEEEGQAGQRQQSRPAGQQSAEGQQEGQPGEGQQPAEEEGPAAGQPAQQPAEGEAAAQDAPEQAEPGVSEQPPEGGSQEETVLSDLQRGRQTLRNAGYSDEQIDQMPAEDFFAAVEQAEPAKTEQAGDRSASVKMMITQEDRRRLGELGYSEDQIRRMRPEEAEQAIQQGQQQETAPAEGEATLDDEMRQESRARLDEAIERVAPDPPAAADHDLLDARNGLAQRIRQMRRQEADQEAIEAARREYEAVQAEIAQREQANDFDPAASRAESQNETGDGQEQEGQQARRRYRYEDFERGQRVQTPRGPGRIDALDRTEIQVGGRTEVDEKIRVRFDDGNRRTFRPNEIEPSAADTAETEGPESKGAPDEGQTRQRPEERGVSERGARQEGQSAQRDPGQSERGEEGPQSEQADERVSQGAERAEAQVTGTAGEATEPAPGREAQGELSVRQQADQITAAAAEEFGQAPQSAEESGETGEQAVGDGATAGEQGFPLRIEPYSDKAYVIRGDTKPHRDRIKRAGGLWSKKLKGGPGWVIRKREADDVRRALSDLLPPESPESQQAAQGGETTDQPATGEGTQGGERETTEGPAAAPEPAETDRFTNLMPDGPWVKVTAQKLASVRRRVEEAGMNPQQFDEWAFRQDLHPAVKGTIGKRLGYPSVSMTESPGAAAARLERAIGRRVHWQHDKQGNTVRPERAKPNTGPIYTGTIQSVDERGGMVNLDVEGRQPGAKVDARLVWFAKDGSVQGDNATSVQQQADQITAGAKQEFGDQREPVEEASEEEKPPWMMSLREFVERRMTGGPLISELNLEQLKQIGSSQAGYHQGKLEKVPDEPGKLRSWLRNKVSDQVNLNRQLEGQFYQVMAGGRRSSRPSTLVHRRRVERALKEGKDVPDEAIIEYPELVRQYRPSYGDGFRDGERVRATLGNGETITGRVRADTAPGERLSIEADQIARAGGVPIGRIESNVHPARVERLGEPEAEQTQAATAQEAREMVSADPERYAEQLRQRFRDQLSKPTTLQQKRRREIAESIEYGEPELELLKNQRGKPTNVSIVTPLKTVAGHENRFELRWKGSAMLLDHVAGGVDQAVDSAVKSMWSFRDTAHDHAEIASGGQENAIRGLTQYLYDLQQAGQAQAAGEESPQPMADWRNTIQKARDYAQKLGIETQGKSREKLVREIEAYLARQETSEQAQQARAELRDAANELGNLLNGRLGANQFADPEVLRASGKVVAKAIKAGYYTFNEAMNQLRQLLGEQFGQAKADRMMRVGAPALEQAWEDIKQIDNEHTRQMGEVGRVADVIGEPPTDERSAEAGDATGADRESAESVSVGDRMAVSGRQAVVIDVQVVDGVAYELYAAEALDAAKAGTVRTKDLDSGEVVSLTDFPTFGSAVETYTRAVSKAGGDTPPQHQLIRAGSRGRTATMETEEPGDGSTRRDDQAAGRPADQAGEEPAEAQGGQAAAEPAETGVSGGEAAVRGAGQPGESGERGDPGAQRAVGDASVAGTEQAGEGEAAEGAGTGRRRQGRSADDDRPATAARSEPDVANHVIEAGDTIAPRGEKTRFRANVEAIRLLKQLEQENRLPTEQEAKTLHQYTGWGWMGEALNRHNEKYREQYDTLAELLTDEELAAARSSTRNAHYTSREVIEQMWALARQAGFEPTTDTTVLEPGSGVGHFFGLMPEGMRQVNLIGVEKDSISARIAQKLYPNADIREAGFEETQLRNNSVDMAIGNVPFGQSKPSGRDYDDLRIHDYFFMRSLDKLKPGGLMIFVSSEGTLNKGDSEVRRMMADKADLVGAIRLPNDAFKANAGTEVTTDIVVLRKKSARPYNGEAFLHLETVGYEEAPNAEGEMENQPIRVNEYFARHPEQVLGRHSLQGKQYNQQADYALLPTQGELAPKIKKAIGNLPANVYGPEAVEAPDSDVGEEADPGSRELSYVERDGVVYQVQDGKLTEPWWLYRKGGEGKTADEAPSENTLKKRKAVARDWIQLRDTLRSLLSAEQDPSASDQRMSELRQQLNEQYDTYRKKHKTPDYPATLNRIDAGNEAARHLREDPDYPLVQALETYRVEYDQDGNAIHRWDKAQIFSQRIRTPKQMPGTADSIEDAVNISMGWHGSIDPELVGELRGISAEQARDEIVEAGAGLENPETGLIEPRAQYLSGHVRSKLRAAQRAAEEDPRYQRNVEALEAVQPETVDISQIVFDLGARWLPTEAVEQFTRDVMKTRSTVKYVRQANGHVVTFHNEGAPARETYSTDRVSADKLLQHALQGTEPQVTDPESDPATGKTRRVVNKQATNDAREKVAQLHRDFVSWANTTSSEIQPDGSDKLTVQEVIENAYNEANNAVVPPQYDGATLALPGLTDAVKRTPHLLSVVERIIHERSAVMAHGVGSGKTFAQIIASMEMRRLGIANKPMIVVDNPSRDQFISSVRLAYPDARVLAPTKKDLEKGNRQRFMSRIALGDYDVVVVTQSQFNRLPNSPRSETEFYQQQLDELESTIVEARQAEGKQSPTAKQLENSRDALQRRLQKARDRAAKQQDETVFFEDLGVDALFIDEAHAYKRIPLVTRMQRVKGIPTGESSQAISLQIKARHVQSKAGGRNLILATGTPVTNTMAEAYVMLRLATPHVLEQYDIHNFDEWAHTFGAVESDVEYTWGGKFNAVERFKQFINVPELQTMTRTGFDVAMGNETLGLDVPAVAGGEPQLVTLTKDEPQQKITKWIKTIADKFEGLDGLSKRDNSWVPIATMQVGMAGALDPRLVDPALPETKNNKVNQAAERIKQFYDQYDESDGTQIVFADRFKPMNTDKLTEFAGESPTDVEVQDTGQLPDTEQSQGDEQESDLDKLSRAEDQAYKAGGFNLYKELRDKLVERGIPRDQIAIAHEHTSDKQREQLYEQVNAGKVRVLIGSTAKVGQGLNVQRKLVAAHHLDPPRMMTPAMLEQRDGRIIRQRHEEGHPSADQVHILRYGTEDSMDAGIYALLANKQKFISQLLTGQDVGRTTEDPADETYMSMQEQLAQLTGDPRMVRQVELQKQVDDLARQKSAHESGQARLRRNLAEANRNVEWADRLIAQYENMLPDAREAFGGEEVSWNATIDGQQYTDRAAIAEALEDAWNAMESVVGEKDFSAHHSPKYRINGYDVQLVSQRWKDHFDRHVLVTKNNENVTASRARTGTGILQSLRQLPKQLENQLEEARQRRQQNQDRVQEIEPQIGQTFERAEELQQKRNELAELEAEMLQNDPRHGGQDQGQHGPTTHAIRMPRLPAKAPKPGKQRRKPATGQTAGEQARPAQEQQPRTEDGRKLIRKIKNDPKGRRIGLRSIVEYVVNLSKAQTRYRLEQTTSRSPAHYEGDGYHLIRSKTEPFGGNFHEAGHAISALVRDRHPQFLEDLGNRIADLTRRPDTWASAVSVEEGFGEWVRYRIMDPEQIPREIDKRVTSFLDNKAPEIMDGIRDARLAWLAHTGRGVDATLRSYTNDKAKRRTAWKNGWHWFLYGLSAGTALDTRVHRPVFKTLQRYGNKVARRFDQKIKDTPADYRTVYQGKLHAPQMASRALYGADKGPEGIVIHATANDPLGKVIDQLSGEQQWRFVNAFGQDLPTGHRFGQLVQLTDYTMHDVIEAVGNDNWEDFEVYGWRKTALYRYENRGMVYPGFYEDQPPEVMRRRIAEVEREHPEWAEQYQRMTEYMNRLLLVPVMSGELTAEEAMDAVEAQEEYWPLPRSVQAGAGKTMGGASGGGAEPDSGIRRAFGSILPFAHILDAMETRVKKAYEAYYQNALMWSIHRMGQQLNSERDLPLEARAVARQIMTPLKLDRQKVAQLDETEQQKEIAKYLDQQRAQELGLESADKLPDEEKTNPADILISFPGEEIWRSVKPHAVRVVAPWKNGQRHYFQVDDPILYRLLAGAPKPGEMAQGWIKFTEAMYDMVKPWKRSLTQNYGFGIWQITSRDPQTAMLLGDPQDPASWVPAGYILRGLYNRVTGEEANAGMSTELLSNSLDSVMRKAHQSQVEKFLNVAGEGILVEGWGRMSNGERLTKVPGQTYAASMKHIDMMNYLSGGRAFAESTETLSREGAYVRAKKRGYSDMYAQTQYDFVTGNFGERSGSPILAAAFRQGGFLNAGLQVLVQTYSRFAHPDPKVKGLHAAKVGYMGALGATMAAAAYLLMDDEDKREHRERTSEDKHRYFEIPTMMKGVRLRLPFDYGPAGAVTSAGYNMVMDRLMKDETDETDLAKFVLKRTASLPAITDILGPHLKTLLEMEVNHSFWWNDPIVPAWMQTAYPRNPSMQTYPDTPGMYKRLGELLNMSPEKIQYGFRNWFTRQGTDVFELTESLIQNERVAESLADMPFFGKIIAREPRGFRAQSVRKLGELDDEYQALSARENRLLDRKLRRKVGTAEYKAAKEKLDQVREKLDPLFKHHRKMERIRALYDEVKRERKKQNPDLEKIRKKERQMTAIARRHLKEQDALEGAASAGE